MLPSCLTRVLVPLCAFAAAPAAGDTIITGGNIVNQTWTTAGSPYIILGDITVPAGAFLFIEPGVSVRVASGDAMGTGRDPSRVEVTVAGGFNAVGTAAAPITFESHTGTARGTWYGIIADPTGSFTLRNASIRHAVIGLSAGIGGLQVQGTRISACSTAGVWFGGGSPVMDLITIADCGDGVVVAAGAPTLSRFDISSCNTAITVRGVGGPTIVNSILRSSGLAAVFLAPGTSSTGTRVRYCTIDGNGVGIDAAGGGVTVRTSIIVRSGNVGVLSSGGAIDIGDSDVWGNAGGDFGGVVPGPGCISVDPLFAGPGAVQLHPASACIDAADGPSAATDYFGTQRPQGARYDLGAFEHPAFCYANCDGSTVDPVLNVSDFVCFQARYAAGDPYANCDGSTVPPVLNVIDFQCFLTRYAGGCP